MSQRHAILATGLVCVGVVLFLSASQAASRLVPDHPQHVGGIEAVCTGIGLDARQDPRWQAFPLKVETVGREGQYLGDVSVSPQRDGIAVADVDCEGPWLLFRVPAGRYQIEAVTEGIVVRSPALVPQTGQARVILRFPQLGGQVSAQAGGLNE